ncbi:MAG: IS200/IS605 family transposase [Bacteroidales bacterium]|nr:IS200/IS605 family transposase [Bacteroidales bacterium]
MANTYTQIYLQFVFAVKGRQCLLQDSFREELHKYISGIIEKRNQKLIAINSVEDHMHIFIGFGTTMSTAALLHDIKMNSSKFIERNNWVKGKFAWQSGYGAFSYSRSHIDRVVKYINNQKEHHRKKTFKEEYLEFLEKYSVDYDERYLFDWVDKK